MQDPLNNISNNYIQDLAKGPLRSVRSYHGYFVNGYKFHTIGHGSSKSTMNSGVCIKGSNLSVDESDYYGQLVDVIEVEYPGLPIKRIVLFKCDWFDPTESGTKVHGEYKLVEINHRRRFNKYEPFILAVQAKQVYFCEYPGATRDKRDWWAVSKVKPRAIVEIPIMIGRNELAQVDAPYQEDDTDHLPQINDDEELGSLNDSNGAFIDIDIDISEEDDELIAEPDLEDYFDEEDTDEEDGDLYLDSNDIDSD